MMQYYITFRSVTFAQRGERALQRGGVFCRLRRTPRWMEEQGCGYCLTVRPEEVGPGVRLLQEEKVPFRKVYLRRENGRLEEAVL